VRSRRYTDSPSSVYLPGTHGVGVCVALLDILTVCLRRLLAAARGTRPKAGSSISNANRYYLSHALPFLAYSVLFPLLLLLASASAEAQTTGSSKYPSRPITFIVPTPAGSEADLPFRLIAKEAEKFLGQPIVVVNKPGASQTIGIAAIAVAKPDGYTIGHAGHPGMFFAPFMEKVPYQPVRDLKQIMQFGSINIAVFAKSDSPFKTFKDVVEFARKNPKKLTYGTSGTGTSANVVMETIAKREGVQFTIIPFKGSPETQAALLGGHVLIAAGGFGHALIEAGETRLLLLLAESRSPAYPEVPILKDLGYDMPAPTLLNVVGPKGLPEEIAKQIEESFTRAMSEPAFIKGMKDLRLTVVYRNSSQLETYVSQNYETMGKLLNQMGFAK
jgi:tripartite-type tricarboxylate transporter receptor subunit TctC